MTNKRIGRLLMLLVGIGLLTGNMEGRGGAPSTERRARPALQGNAALAELERRGQYRLAAPGARGGALPRASGAAAGRVARGQPGAPDSRQFHP